MLNENKTKFQITSFIVLVVMLFAGCTVGSMYNKKGIDLINSGKYDAAINYYKRILRNNPNNSSVKTFLTRAKLYGYYYHLALARKFRDKNDKDSAISEYKKCLNLYSNKPVEEEFRLFVNGDNADKPVVISSDIEPPYYLKIDNNRIDSISLKLTPIKQIFRTVGKSYGVNFIFDKDFRDFPFSFEVSNIGFFEIVNQLCLVSNTKYRIVDSSSVLIYPNTSFKKRAFDLKGVKVFFLSNITAEDLKKLLLPLFRDEQIIVQEDPNLNAVIVKGNSKALKSIEKFIRKIDKAKSEVEFDIEILEINRNLLNKIGADFGTTITTMNAGIVNESGGIDTKLNLNNLKSTNFFLTLPNVALNLLGSDDNSKILAKPNLRGVNGEEIKFMVGDEIPIPQTTLQAIAAGGVETTPVTTYQYKNVGVEIKLTPYVHRKGEVTIKLKLTMNFVTTYVDQFPVLGKRELENTIRLKEGESSIIGGFIRDETRGKIKGLPFISKLPLIGRLFGSSEDTIRQTDIIFSITPRFIREVEVDKESRKAIWSDSGEGVSTLKKKNTPLGKGKRINRFNNTEPGTISINPGSMRVKVGSSAEFSIRINSDSEVSTISLRGIVEGGKAVIEDLKTVTDSEDNIRVLKNFSGSSFDIGYSFLKRPVKYNDLGVVKIKFLEKGNYSIKFSSIFSSFNRKPIKLKGGESKITVY